MVLSNRSWKLSAKFILVLIAAILVLSLLGATYQAIGYWRDGRVSFQQGRSVRVGSIRFNLNCSGSGRPSVVLESGMGGSSLDWLRVQPGIAQFSRVCSYDRAGYGWSDPSPASRTSAQIATELKKLLTSAGEQGPYILVGHSFGGYNVRMFNELYQSDVAGMVLVDAEHPDEELRQKELQNTFAPSVRASIEERSGRQRFWSQVTDQINLYLGIDRLKLALGRKYSPIFPDELQHEILFLEQQPKYIEAVKAESRLDAESAAQVRASRSLGSRPLIVLTAGIPYAGNEDDDLLADQQKAKRDNLWIHELQAEYVNLSSRGKQVVVQGSSHEMPADRPDAIIAAVHEVWSDVKSNSLQPTTSKP